MKKAFIVLIAAMFILQFTVISCSSKNNNSLNNNITKVINQKHNKEIK